MNNLEYLTARLPSVSDSIIEAAISSVEKLVQAGIDQYTARICVVNTFKNQIAWRSQNENTL